MPSQAIRTLSERPGALHDARPPSIAGLSDIGRTRARNEDSLSLLPDVGVAVVADGMGGHPGGDVASRLAAETAASVIAQALESAAPEGEGTERMGEAMSRCVQQAHEAIRAHAREEPELDGMGTTLTAMVVEDRAGTWAIGHVGDSRAYRLRGGELTQLTRDDTWVQERVETGQISAEQARHHPFAHLLTQCLGLSDPPVPQILHGRFEPGDVYLLCTDGLVGMLDDEAIGEILAAAAADPGDDGGAHVRALVDAANEAGGHDNITAAVVRIAPA